MITEQDLTAARAAWAEALMAVSKAYDDEGIDAAKALASDIIDTAYGYDLGPVLFKPTLSGGEKTFRTTKKGCLSYFVGHDPEYPLDAGFGLRSWRKVRSETAASFLDGNTGIWMGWMFFTDKNGETIKTDKTFGYTKDANGAVRIVLHHSSLPYEA